MTTKFLLGRKLRNLYPIRATSAADGNIFFFARVGQTNSLDTDLVPNTNTPKKIKVTIDAACGWQQLVSQNRKTKSAHKSTAPRNRIIVEN